MRFLPLLALLSVTAPACGDAGENPSAPKTDATDLSAKLDGVHWTAVGPVGEQITKDELTANARKVLARVPAAGKRPAHRRIELQGSIDTTAGEGALMLEARFAGSAAGVPIGATLVATGGTGTVDEARVLLDKGLRDLASALSALVRLAGGAREEWIRALNSAEPDEQLLAVELLRKNRVREAVPELGKLLTDPREPVSEAAADALVEIGDRAAVPLLIRSIRRGDLRSEVRAIEALGRLGGPEARAYLEMTAGGHEVEEVRRLSERALQRLPASK